MEEGMRISVNSKDLEKEKEKAEICRICYEPAQETKLLIHPCKCAGSLKYIHEDYLKIWLLSLKKNFDDRKCELCQCSFIMEYKMVNSASFKEILKQSIATCVFMPILALIFAMILAIIYFLTQKYFSSGATDEEKVYSLAIISVCAVAGIIILLLLLCMIKSAFIKKKVTDWKILNQEVETDETERVQDKNDGELIVKDSSSKFVKCKSAELKERNKKESIVVPIPYVVSLEGIQNVEDL
jgi:hypothetical protein